MGNAAVANLPTPDFTYGPPFRRHAGLRPFRDAGFRLDWEETTSPRKLIVHNYGHGGAGITLSWGCASKVRDIVRTQRARAGGTSIAVLGSGVMGLTAATLLFELGLPISIYTENTWSSTTSSVAGGQWAPSIVNYSDSDEQLFKDILTVSYQTFQSSSGFGVSERDNYTPQKDPALEVVLQLLPGLLPARQTLKRLPFKHHTNGGYLYKTLLVEPPIFLKRLDSDLRAKNVPIVCRTFSTVRDVLSLSEDIIVNCTGLGSKIIWGDLSLRPIKGQLALLDAQLKLQYLYSRSGYLFPRTDAVIIGGSVEETFTTPDADPAFCQHLVAHMAGLFGEGPPVALSKDHIDSPNNAMKLAPQAVVTS
jgi:D-amino-acid oxidase